MDSMNEHAPTPHDHLDGWIIEGFTRSGQVFRPSNWALRLCGCLAVYQRQRLRYSALLMPTQHEGHASIRVLADLAEAHPEIHQQVFQFAHFHDLCIHELIRPETDLSTTSGVL